MLAPRRVFVVSIATALLPCGYVAALENAVLDEDVRTILTVTSLDVIERLSA